MKNILKKIFWILYQPYKFLIFAPWLVISTLIFGNMAVILIFILSPQLTSYICGAIWSKLNVFMTPMLVKVIGRENINKNQSYVIVANHQSQYDIFVIYGWMGVDFKWVMKQELRKVPGIGIGCEKLDHIFIDRSNPESAIVSINKAKKKIVNGTSVFFFAEGKRSIDGSLGDFKKGAFKFAIDLKLPILPVTIVGTEKILPSNTMNLFPGKVKMIIHKPIIPDEYNDHIIPDLMKKTREVILSGKES